MDFNLTNLKNNLNEVYNTIYKKSEIGTGIDNDKVKYELIKYLALGLISYYCIGFYFKLFCYFIGIIFMCDMIFLSNMNFSLIILSGNCKLWMEWYYEMIKLVANSITFILSAVYLLACFLFVNIAIIVFCIVYNCFEKLYGFSLSVCSFFNDRCKSTNVQLVKPNDVVNHEPVIDEPKVTKCDSNIPATEILIDVEKGLKSFNYVTLIEILENDGETFYVLESTS